MNLLNEKLRSSAHEELQSANYLYALIENACNHYIILPLDYKNLWVEEYVAFTKEGKTTVISEISERHETELNKIILNIESDSGQKVMMIPFFTSPPQFIDDEIRITDYMIIEPLDSFVLQYLVSLPKYNGILMELEGNNLISLELNIPKEYYSLKEVKKALKKYDSKDFIFFQGQVFSNKIPIEYESFAPVD
ncbi:MAG: hypothetical protein Q4F57_04155 [Weeksellaceae bacterium]|nr:hypothetical protein [Weeksellaceae bacterium]